MTTNFISIKSVLYDLSLTLDDRYYNENKMTEWLAHGYRKLDMAISLEPKSMRLAVNHHKANLPSDFKFLIQVAEYVKPNVETISYQQDLPSDGLQLTAISSIPWRVMRLTSNPYHANICLNMAIANCTDCAHEFSISPSLVLTTTLTTGIIEVAYLG
jgi:hypothetical protein